MSVYTNPPEWEAQGKKPPSSKRTEGWKPGDRVPASWLNWFWFSTANSLRELAQAFNNYYTRDEVDTLLSVSIPRGVIVMWSGRVDEIPDGWALCDGTNNTPDLRDRFIVGAGGEYDVGETGGAKEVALSLDQIPRHRHTGSTDVAGVHTHSGTTDEGGAHKHTISIPGGLMWSGIGGGRSPSIEHPQEINTSVDGEHAHAFTTDEAGEHTHDVITDYVGGGQPHENRPPYYALCYIMKL